MWVGGHCGRHADEVVARRTIGILRIFKVLNMSSFNKRTMLKIIDENEENDFDDVDDGGHDSVDHQDPSKWSLYSMIGWLRSVGLEVHESRFKIFNICGVHFNISQLGDARWCQKHFSLRFPVANTLAVEVYRRLMQITKSLRGTAGSVDNEKLSAYPLWDSLQCGHLKYCIAICCKYKVDAKVIGTRRRLYQKLAAMRL